MASGRPGRIYLNTSTNFVEVWNGITTLVLGGTISLIGNPNTIASRDSAGALTAQKFIGPLNGNADSATVAANTPLLAGQGPAFYLDRNNHTGTILSSVISDLPANIRSVSLDQFSLPAASLSANGFTLLAVGDPVNPTDASNKRYVDNTVSSTNSAFLTKAVYDPTSSGTVGYANNALLLSGAGPGYYLSRGNHSGTQLSSTIADFASAVAGTRLSALTVPTADLSLNGFKIKLLATPAASTDAATKGYVDTSIGAIPATSWTSITGTPALRGTLAALPSPTDTSSATQTESAGYDQYFVFGVSTWRRVMTIPFRPWVAIPATATSTGVTGQTAYDSAGLWFFICVATNTWRRFSLVTWSGTSPFAATAATNPGLEFTDGTYYYLSVALNVWVRAALSSFGSGVSTTAPVPNASYHPGQPWSETTDGSFWYLCVSPNNWLRTAITTF